MNLIIDFTQPTQQYSISQLQNMQQINQITFIVPIFIFLQNNCQLIFQYVKFLSQRPLIKTNVKPVGSQDQYKKLEAHSVVVVRGTFDHFHLGHQVLLLKSIFSTSQKLIIQVKADQILHNKQLHQLIQPSELRKQNVRKYVQSIRKLYDNIKTQIQIKIQTINEVYGSVTSTKGIDAIVLSQQSLHSQKYIRKLRKSNGLKRVKIIISPLITSHLEQIKNPGTVEQQIQRQKRINAKISSYKIREAIIAMNNFTLEQYISYREIWDTLVKQIYALCRIKDIDFMISQKWFERVLYKHTIKPMIKSSKAKKVWKTNREIYLQITSHNNISTPNQHSLHQVSISLALLLQDTQEDQKNIQGVVRNFLQNLLKKKGKLKSCKKIRKMILTQIKQYLGKDNQSKGEGLSAISSNSNNNNESKNSQKIKVTTQRNQSQQNENNLTRPQIDNQTNQTNPSVQIQSNSSQQISNKSSAQPTSQITNAPNITNPEKDPSVTNQQEL